MRTYISDIYNVKTNKRFKYINQKSISSEYYCVEIRDTATDEQIALCRPDEMLEGKYRCSYGVVNPNRLQVLERSFIDLLSYLNIEMVKCDENIQDNLILAKDYNLKNTDLLWYNRVVVPTFGDKKVEYFNLFEFLVIVQSLHPSINLYGVGTRYIKLSHVTIKLTVEKDLTVPITKYIIRRKV